MSASEASILQKSVQPQPTINYMCDIMHQTTGKHIDYTVIPLIKKPELKETAALWFHEKWGIPLEVYTESMELCLRGLSAVPQWYAAEKNGKIIGGCGVIENDFHDRPDLSPNVCAVYTEKDYRGNGIAGALLEKAASDMKQRGVSTLYLVTDHTDFYERYGWNFLCMVQSDGENRKSRMYVRHS